MEANKRLPIEKINALIPTKPILLVDDSRGFLKESKKLFEAAHCPVTLAQSIAEARDRLSQYDCSGACVDLRLGDNNGLYLLADVLDAQPDFPIVLMSQYRSLQSAVTALKMGARDFLIKPLNVEQVLTSLFSTERPECLKDMIVDQQPHSDSLMLGDRTSLEAIENEHIRRTILREKSITKAAEILQIHRTTLFRKKHLWTDS